MLPVTSTILVAVAGGARPAAVTASSIAITSNACGKHCTADTQACQGVITCSKCPAHPSYAHNHIQAAVYNNHRPGIFCHCWAMPCLLKGFQSWLKSRKTKQTAPKLAALEVWAKCCMHASLMRLSKISEQPAPHKTCHAGLLTLIPLGKW